jgi:hypothetical protein
MDEAKDPILEGKETQAIRSGEETSFFSAGLDVISLSQEQVEFVGKKFTEVFEYVGSSRNGLVMIRGSLFALGSRKHNAEWREHAASSARELLHRWKRNIPYLIDDLKRTYSQNDNFPTFESHPDEYRRMVAFYSYFSCICHHEANAIIICSRELDGEERKSGHDSEEDFIEKVRVFFLFFHRFFTQHTQ